MAALALVMNVPREWSLLLLMPLLGMQLLVQATSNSGLVETIEYLDGVTEHAATENPRHAIGTNGYWDAGPVLLVHVSAGEGVEGATVQSAINLINNVTDSSVSEWNELLNSFKGSAPTLSITDDPGQANIRVVLTDEEHPEGKLGKARLYVIKGVGQIISAEVTIFDTSSVHENGTLQYSLSHELGHALGLSHSTDPRGIMYHILNFENGSVQNYVGSCEAKGISALYVESVVGHITC